jgi:CRISPR-associated protein Csy2
MRIQNANALSSPYTIGFPAMTAWLGAVHAIERIVQQKGMPEVSLIQTAVACHDFLLQTYKGKGDFVQSIIGTANPLKKNKKTGEYERPPFIEGARCHLAVSLLIETVGIHGDNKDNFLSYVSNHLYKMKMAGGDILSFKGIEMCFVDEESIKQEQMLIRKLMPGYVPVERKDLMLEAMAEGKDALDALMEYLQVKHHLLSDKDGSEHWDSIKREDGWLVPLAVGFLGISDLGRVENQRDENTLHCFAESIVTLGEFKMPYRFQHIDEMMWKYSPDLQNNMYLCKNQ